MELKNNLEAPSARILQSMSLGDLEIKVNESVEANISRSEIFNILMTWFNEQIKQDISIQRHLGRFVKLLNMRNHAGAEPFTLAQVDEVFNGWLEKDAIQNPAYRRRYLITQQDLRRVFAETPDQSDNFKHTGKFPHQQRNDTRSQGADVDAVVTAGEAFVIDSSPDAKVLRISTTITRRGRKRDVPEPSVPPKNYICKRCDEPGHMLQDCPTNLDPRYDQAPARDYRCVFCGQHGNHYATLCPKNPHESSLTKQREKAVTRNREPQTPSRSGRRNYQDREALTIRSRNQYRSHSPQQRARDRYRSRSPPACRHRQRGGDGYSTRTVNEGDRYYPQYSDELDVSPYTTRARLTRELQMSLNATDRRESPSRSGNDPSRSECQHDTSLLRSPVFMRAQKQDRDLDKVTRRGDEGRLAYDDEIDALAEPKASLCATVTDLSRHTISIDEDDMAESEMLSMMEAPEDLKKIEDEVEDFFCALAADMMLKGKDNEMGVDRDPPRETRIDDHNHSDVATEPDMFVVQTTPGPKYRLVQCPQFSPEIVALFHASETPIINVRAKRQTASSMMERYEGFYTSYSKHANENAAAHGVGPQHPE